MLNLKYLVLSISLLSILHSVKSEGQVKSKCNQTAIYNCVLTKKIEIFTNQTNFFAAVLSCNATNATAESTGCPKGSNCIENGTVNGTLQAYCVCGFNVTVNENYLITDNKTQYCIEKENETHPTESPPKATDVPTTSSPTSKPATKPTAKPDSTESPTTKAATTTTKHPESDKNEVKIAPAPAGHHLVGGILLPIMIVLAFIGAVFAIRKYDLIERAHGYIRGRGNQATRGYNGLMENDFDDDPLLI